MKIGDQIPVQIAGDTVAQAKIVEMDRQDNTVTLEFPGRRVVMGLKIELDTTPVVEESSVVITGVDRVDSSGNVVDAQPAERVAPEPVAVEAPAIVETVETAPVVEAPAVETSE